MSRITNWKRESRTPTLAYRNTETGTRAVLHRTPDSYHYKWRGVILDDGYPVWSRGYETKDAKSFRDELRKRPAPELSCPECPNDDVVAGADHHPEPPARTVRPRKGGEVNGRPNRVRPRAEETRLPSVEEFRQRVEERAKTGDLSMDEITELVHETRDGDR